MIDPHTFGSYRDTCDCGNCVNARCVREERIAIMREANRIPANAETPPEILEAARKQAADESGEP